MWRLKLLLLPFAAAVELLLLATCWMLAVCNMSKASAAIHGWATTTLPDIAWYIRE